MYLSCICIFIYFIFIYLFNVIILYHLCYIYFFTDYFILIFTYIFTYFLICFIFTLFYNSNLFLFIYLSFFTSILAPVSPASSAVHIPCWSTHVAADTATLGWRERNQQDATNLIFIIKLLSQHVSGIIMPIIRRTRVCTAAYGALHWLWWLWLCGAGTRAVCTVKVTVRRSLHPTFMMHGHKNLKLLHYFYEYFYYCCCPRFPEVSRLWLCSLVASNNGSILRHCMSFPNFYLEENTRSLHVGLGGGRTEFPKIQG